MTNFKNWSKEALEDLAGSYNGEDNQFVFEDEIYHQDDAHAALEELEKRNN